MEILYLHLKFFKFPHRWNLRDSQFLESLHVTSKAVHPRWWREWMPVLHSVGPFCTHGPGILGVQEYFESVSAQEKYDSNYCQARINIKLKLSI